MIRKLLFAVALVLSVQSVSRAQNILILEDGGTQDSVYSILSQAGFNVTLGGPYWQYTGMGINQYRLVIFLNGVIYVNAMPDSVQWKIRNYIRNGGGLLTTEWILWDGNSFGILAPILPSTYGGTYSYAPEWYHKSATHAISQNLPDSFFVPNDWSFSNAVRDTTASKQAITVFTGALSGDAVVSGRYGNGKVVHWNMGGHYIGANIWSSQVKTLLRNIASYTQGVSSVDEQAGIPQESALGQNYPNPFNPSTTIRFDLPKSGYVKLAVYNLLGQEIETLVNEKLLAGEFQVNWNAKGHPSGVYFYRLQGDDFVLSKKAILLK